MGSLALMRPETMKSDPTSSRDSCVKNFISSWVYDIVVFNMGKNIGAGNPAQGINTILTIHGKPDERKEGVIHHVQVIGINPFRHNCFSPIVFYLPDAQNL